MKYEINPDHAAKFKDFLINIKDYFKKNQHSIHKARNELKIISYEGIDTVVKAFKIPHLLNRIVYTFFRDSKAKKSYKNALRVGDYTPKPIGYIEFYKYGLINESFFVSEKFSYDFTIREPLLDQSFANRKDIFKAFAQFTLQLHDHDIFHDDYSPGNILIKTTPSGYIFKIVDINRMKFIKLDQNMRAKNFAKLWASEEALTIIATEYAKLANYDQRFIQKTLHYSLQNKKIKNFKKRLKGKEIDW